MKTGVQLIAKERKRQIDVEAWDARHDSSHDADELAIAAACYAMPEDQRKYKKKWRALCERVPKKWPWEWAWWKPTPKDRIRELVKAGALIAAEIDRLQKQNNL